MSHENETSDRRADGVVPVEAELLLAGRYIATLSTHRPDGSIHVVPVAFMYDPDETLIRIIAPESTHKVRNIRAGSTAVVCFVDGGLWATIEGSACVTDDAGAVQRTLEQYTAKYGPPHGNRSDYVAIEVRPTRVMGRFVLPGRSS